MGSLSLNATASRILNTSMVTAASIQSTASIGSAFSAGSTVSALSAAATVSSGPLHAGSLPPQCHNSNIYKTQMIALSVVAAFFVTIAAVVLGWRAVTCVREEDKNRRRSSVPCPHDAHEVLEALLDQQLYGTLSPATSMLQTNSETHGSVRAMGSAHLSSLSSNHTFSLYYDRPSGTPRTANTIDDDNMASDVTIGRSTGGYEAFTVEADSTKRGRNDDESHDDVEEDVEFGDDDCESSYELISNQRRQGSHRRRPRCRPGSYRQRRPSKKDSEMAEVDESARQEIDNLDGQGSGDDTVGKECAERRPRPVKQFQQSTGYKPVYN